MRIFVLFFLSLLFVVILLFWHRPLTSSLAEPRAANEDCRIKVIDHPHYLPKIKNDGNSSVFLVGVRVTIREPTNISELRLKAFVKAENSSTPASQLYSEENGGFLYPHSSWEKMPLLPVEEDHYFYEVTFQLRLHNYSGYSKHLRFAAQGILEVSMKDMEKGKVIKAGPHAIELLSVDGGGGEGDECAGGTATDIFVTINKTLALQNMRMNDSSSFPTISAICLESANETFAFVPLTSFTLNESLIELSASFVLPEYLTAPTPTPPQNNSHESQADLRFLVLLFNGFVLVFEGVVDCDLVNASGVGGGAVLRAEICDEVSSLPPLLINELYYNSFRGYASGPNAHNSSLPESCEWLELYHSGSFAAHYDDIMLNCRNEGDDHSFALHELTLEPHSLAIFVLTPLSESEKNEFRWHHPNKNLFFSNDVVWAEGPGNHKDILSDTGGEIFLFSEWVLMDAVSYGFFDGDGMPYNEIHPYSNKGYSLVRVVMPDSSLGLSPSVPSPGANNTLLEKKNTVVTAFSSPDTSMDVLRELITGAKESIYIEMYSFSHKEILELLLSVKKRQVDVRIILEHEHATEWERNYTSIVASLLDDGGIEVRWSPLSLNDSYIFQHSKFLVIDNTTITVMSANFGRAGITETGYLGNREWGVVIEEHEIVYSFLQKFHLDWRNALEYSFYGEGVGVGTSRGGDDDEDGDGVVSEGGGGGGGRDVARYLPGAPKRSVLPLVFREESFCFEREEVGIPVDDLKMFAWNLTSLGMNEHKRRTRGGRWGAGGEGSGEKELIPTSMMTRTPYPFHLFFLLTLVSQFSSSSQVPEKPSICSTCILTAPGTIATPQTRLSPHSLKHQGEG